MLSTVKTLIASAVMASPAAAGWDNVFQLTCCDGPKARTSYYEAPAPASDCTPQPKVEYIQRSYYQPETSYKRESYYVPVKENVKSYYYEPVTSYKYTSYYDPCSGQCQQICTPTTSYAVKEKCNSVTRWVEQSRMVPVTSYRAVTSYTPVVTYYYPPVSSPSSFKIPIAPPQVNEQRNVAPAPELELIPKKELPTQPNSVPRAMPPANSKTSAAYTASRSKGSVRGEVVKNDQATPRPNTKVIFLSATDTTKREEAMTNNFGEFDVKLPAGEWYVYLGQGTGKATFHKKLTVGADDNRDVTLVSR
ncbi:hypothetical protein BH11PLA2_BH11PLA2_10780 [soil metagenome]